jgi:hypothetical protein
MNLGQEFKGIYKRLDVIQEEQGIQSSEIDSLSIRLQRVELDTADNNGYQEILKRLKHLEDYSAVTTKRIGKINFQYTNLNENFGKRLKALEFKKNTNK